MELHDENTFKVRSYNTAVYNLERLESPLSNMVLEDLAKLSGVGKSIAATIDEINQTQGSEALVRLKEKTPNGIMDMLEVKGLGPKKIRTVWQELGITSIDAMLQAAQKGQLAKLKGFGDKTQTKVEQVILYYLENQSRVRYKEAEEVAKRLEKEVMEPFPELQFSSTGALRRRLEIIEVAEVLIGTENVTSLVAFLDQLPWLEKDTMASGPLVWRGKLKEESLKVSIRICNQSDFAKQLFIHSGAPAHLQAKIKDQKSLLQLVEDQVLSSETEAYELAGLPYIEPELREGLFEFSLAENKPMPELLSFDDFTGILHNHSSYSDGKNSLADMAKECQALGYQYFGISDHSKTAVYANGLDEDRIIEQHKEVDRLNQEMAPFRIFKGIESDILNDGALDYEDDVLQSFDFIVASIHFNLNMDKDKATQRLIAAIKNPYTTILGHPTGRLLLRREGYPIDHRAVIDACAENGVIIEINANPRRLDLDWRWVHYAIEQNVMLSVNPDAHSKAGLKDMYYGWCAGRKGGLTKNDTFNCLSLKQLEQYFDRKKQIAQGVLS